MLNRVPGHEGGSGGAPWWRGGRGRVGVSPALPALAATWSSPVALPGSCGSSVAVNQAGAMAAGGTFTASTAPRTSRCAPARTGRPGRRRTWARAATRRVPGTALSWRSPRPGRRSRSGKLAVLDLHRRRGGGRASGRRQLGRAGHPQHRFGPGRVRRRAGDRHDGAGNVIAGWSTNPGDATDAVRPAGSSSWGPATTLSVEGSVGPAHSLSLAVNSGGSVIITFNGGLNNLWAVSGTVTGGFSAPVMLASGAGSNHYNPIGTSQVALNNAGQASVAWSVLGGQTGLLTRSPSGAWTDKVVATRSAPALAVSTAIDGAGNAIAVFGSSYAWDLAGAAGRRRVAAVRIIGRAGRRRPGRHLRLRRHHRQRVHLHRRRHQLRYRQRITHQPGRPEDRPRPGRPAGRRCRISRACELTTPSRRT